MIPKPEPIRRGQKDRTANVTLVFKKTSQTHRKDATDITF